MDGWSLWSWSYARVAQAAGSRESSGALRDSIEIKAQAGGPGARPRDAVRAEADRRARIWAKAIASSAPLGGVIPAIASSP